MRKRKQLNARIGLIKRIVSRVIRIPRAARGLDIVEIHTARDRGQLLQELDAEALRHVPRDVAVEEPRAGVVGRVRDDQPAPGGEHRGVTARRVAPLERWAVRGRVVGTEAVPGRDGIRQGRRCAQDQEVVSLVWFVPVSTEGSPWILNRG